MNKIYVNCVDDQEYTEQEVLDEYWDFWSKKMIKKYGEGHELITKENCIGDWLVINWGHVKKEK